MRYDKTLLILGGSRYLLPVIDAAYEMCARVVTCDYLPNNYAHVYADEYVNASIIDKEAMLEVARRVHADGVMSFAADPGVVSAAYVAESLDLPFQCSYEVACILQNKDLFRAFMQENDFNCPIQYCFSSVEQAMTAADELPYPVIVKPTDSAGSKGVTRVDGPENLKVAVKRALEFSLSKKCIVEQFLEKSCDSSDSDSFVLDGQMVCVSFSSQLFDRTAPNPYVPSAYVMPAALSSSMPSWAQKELTGELQRLADLLELQSGVFNIETRVASDGKAYIMEMSPRGVGNNLCEMLRLASDVDLIRASVQAALDLPVQGVHSPDYDGFWYQQILHSNSAGIYQGLSYAPGFCEEHVVEERLWIQPGEQVEAWTAANHAFGSVFLQFDSLNAIEGFCAEPAHYMRVDVSKGFEGIGGGNSELIFFAACLRQNLAEAA